MEMEWKKLDPDKRICLSYNIFRKVLLNFIRPSENKICNIHDQVGIKLLTRLRLRSSHLHKHKFRHDFEGTLNPLCPCSIEAENTLYFFLRCQFFNDIWEIFMNCVKNVQIRSFFGPVLPCIQTEYGDLRSKSPYSVRILENTAQKKLHIWTVFTQY